MNLEDENEWEEFLKKFSGKDPFEEYILAMTYILELAGKFDLPKLPHQLRKKILASRLGHVYKNHNALPSAMSPDGEEKYQYIMVNDGDIITIGYLHTPNSPRHRVSVNRIKNRDMIYIATWHYYNVVQVWEIPGPVLWEFALDRLESMQRKGILYGTVNIPWPLFMELSPRQLI